MTNKHHGKIVCPIRGGTSSRHAEERAIQLGAERDDPVVFVHIVDETRTQPNTAPLSDAVLAEKERMGESFLCIAVERARTRGINAEQVVLHGPVAATLEKFLLDSHATVLVVGSPEQDAKHSNFSRERFDQFVEHVWSTLRVDVVIV